MARKNRFVSIPSADPEKNRDQGKLYFIEEMPASQIEAWAIRIYQGMVRAGVPIPDGAQNSGMAGLAVMTFQAIASIPYGELHELLNELMECATIVRDRAHKDVRQPLMEIDCEEVSTRLLLKMEAFELHTGFSLAALKSKLTSGTAMTSDSSSTQISPASLES